MRTKTLLLIVLASTTLAPASCKKTRTGIGGEYLAEGTNPDGSPYRGVVNIKKEGDGYYVHWSVANKEYEGNGRLRGKTLTVDWGAPDPVIYDLLPDGVLKGTWARGEATETLTPQ